MPEYPDVTIYIERLDALVRGRPLRAVRLASPFVLRTVSPRPSELAGATVRGLRRIGKRIVFELEGARFLVIHLMVAGRFRWKDQPKAKIPGRVGLLALDFDHGTLILTEASKKKRASLHVVDGEDALAELDPGGLEVFDLDEAAFADRLRENNHTLKRALTDPRIFSGIGNAYSDEILWEAQLSPITWTTRLSDDEVARLYRTVREVLTTWTERFRDEVGDGFPGKVTAFRPEMAVHGKYKEPCPRCGDPVQRIRYADNETNYCPTCQNDGKLLADRSLSRLLKKDWPKTLDELEDYKAARKVT